MAIKKEETGILDFLKKYGSIVTIIAALVGNYYVSQYKLEQLAKADEKHEQALSSLSARVKVTESVNYELLSKQLQAIQNANTEIRSEVTATNKRVDSVLELMIKQK